MAKSKVEQSRTYTGDSWAETQAPQDTRVMTRSETPEVVVPSAPVLRRGRLWSCSERGKISLCFDANMDREGESYAIDEDAPVTINGVETTLGDLRRGDNVVLEGDKVSKVDATR